MQFIPELCPRLAMGGAGMTRFVMYQCAAGKRTFTFSPLWPDA